MADPTSPPPSGLLEVGRVGRAHGIQGGVYVTLTTDIDERLDIGARLWARDRWLTVESSSHQRDDRWIVHFDGVADRTAAERLTGTHLLAEPVDDPDALWVHELVGAEVVEVGGTSRGVCVAVVANPAHDLLELEDGALVPIIFVVGLVDGVVTIDPPEGLFD